MTRPCRLAAIVASVLALVAGGRPAAPPEPDPAAGSRVEFTVGDGDHEFKSRSALGSMLAVWLVPEGGPRADRLAREVFAGALGLAGARHLLAINTDAEEFRRVAGAAPRGKAVALARDEAGGLARKLGVTPARTAIVVLDERGVERLRVEPGAGDPDPTFAELARRVDAATRDAAAAEGNAPSGLALEGYDPVAYIELGRATPGARDLESLFRGVRYRFASEPHREKFNADPTRYVPAYGGWCATAMAKGKKVQVDPRNFLVTEGRLFLFYDGTFANARREWLKDERNLTSRADAQWRALTERESPAPAKRR